jgi:peptidoglycan hydrolase-like protein with peptidoglycan-binding domain
LHLRKAIAILAAGLACSAGLPAATTQKKKSTHPKTAAPARRTRRKPSAHAVQKAPARPARTTWRPGQTAPTPGRYKEIQEALAKKGYLHGDANGVWNQDSADALRRFQQDQSLQASGKLDSLSIIALGLGPKY